MQYLAIHTDRQSDNVEDLLKAYNTFTIGELIKYLSSFDEDMPVVTYAERNLTYNFGSVWYDSIEEMEN